MLLSITESIKSFFLETVGRELCVFFCSMIPIIELRGAIPIGAALKMSPLATYLISVAGNMLPVPFILLFIKAIMLISISIIIKILKMDHQTVIKSYLFN